MKRLCTVLVLSFLCGAFCAADTPYALFVENDHWIYDAMHILSVESRKTTLADRQPLSKGELAEYFSAFDNASVPDMSMPLYRMMQGYFSGHPFLYSNKYLSFDVNGVFALQGQYVHKRENEVRLDRFLRYNRTPAIASAPMHVMFTPYVNFWVDVALRGNFWANEWHPSYMRYVNIPLVENGLEGRYPIRAGATFSNSFCSISIGRGQLNIGRSLAGSMLLADTVDRLDHMTAAFFVKNLRFSMNVLEIDPTRFVFSHEAAFRPLDWISVRLYEGSVVNAPFDPKYLNPMMIFHNYFGWLDPSFNKSKAGNSGTSLVGCQLGVTLDIVPIKGLRLYGQYGQNQFQTFLELKQSPAAKNIPNGLGGLAGIEYIHPFSFGHLSVTGEFLYASPWMYIMENKYISLYYHRTEMISKRAIDIWLANPYGPDTMGCFFQCALIEPAKYKAKFKYRFLVKGDIEDNFFDSSKETDKDIYYPPSDHYDPIAQAKTPSGNPAYFHTISLEGSYRVIKQLELNAGLNWTIVSGRKSGHAVDIYSSIKYTIR